MVEVGGPGGTFGWAEVGAGDKGMGNLRQEVRSGNCLKGRRKSCRMIRMGLWAWAPRKHKFLMLIYRGEGGWLGTHCVLGGSLLLINTSPSSFPSYLKGEGSPGLGQKVGENSRWLQPGTRCQGSFCCVGQVRAALSTGAGVRRECGYSVVTDRGGHEEIP